MAAPYLARMLFAEWENGRKKICFCGGVRWRDCKQRRQLRASADEFRRAQRNTTIKSYGIHFSKPNMLGTQVFEAALRSALDAWSVGQMALQTGDHQGSASAHSDCQISTTEQLANTGSKQESSSEIRTGQFVIARYWIRNYAP